MRCTWSFVPLILATLSVGSTLLCSPSKGASLGWSTFNSARVRMLMSNTLVGPPSPVNTLE